MAEQGVETGKFGEWLTDYLQSLSDYRVYFDHGDASRYANVLATKAFYGKTVSSANRLADLDVVVVGPENTALLVIEIEERPCPPKKILGDVLALILCNRLAARVDGRQLYYQLTHDTVVVIAGVQPGGGYRLKKIRDLIEPRLHELEAPKDLIDPRKVRLLFDERIADVIEGLKAMVREIFPTGTHG